VLAPSLSRALFITSWPRTVLNSLNHQVSGEQRARFFAQCRPRLPRVKDEDVTDLVIDNEHAFLFIDNVKAASSTVRAILSQFGADWCMDRLPKMAGVYYQGCGSHLGCSDDCCPRFTSSCLSSRWLEGKYVFGFVRDPVEKFESGVRQAKFQDADAFANLTADDILDKQLAIAQDGSSTPWLNEHLQPSTFRFNVLTRDGGMFPLGFIGATETFAADWPRVLAELQRRGVRVSAEMQKLASVEANQREEDPMSKLSDQSVKKLCASALYQHEWECFGYQKPAACL
jgi:hypothetical protein